MHGGVQEGQYSKGIEGDFSTMVEEEVSLWWNCLQFCVLVTRNQASSRFSASAESLN